MKRVVTVGLLLVGLAIPAGASAESLVFVKKGNVWASRADGSHAHRITRDGTRRLPYVHPTQANNGTIVALRGTDMFRYTRGGRRIGKPRRVSAGLSGPGSLHELAEASEVSPNAKRVALQKTLLQGKSGNGVSGMQILAVSVEYRTARTGKRVREVHQPGDYYQSPSWVGNSRALIFAPYNSYSPEVFVDTFGGSTEGWFSDEHSGEPDPFGRQPIDDGELNRAGDRIAFVRGTNVKGDWAGALFEVDTVTSFSEIPTPLCSFVPPGPGPFSGPSWSPDGSSLAWSNGSGVWTARLNPSSGDCGVTPRLVARGGRAVDWSAG
jgi:WD40-like Beta Propeller Repeat